MPSEFIDFDNQCRTMTPVEILELLYSLFIDYGDSRASAVDDENLLNRLDYACVSGIIERKMHILIEKLKEENTNENEERA